MGDFGAVLRRWGKPAAVCRDGETARGNAIVQPILEKDRQRTPSPLGRKRRDRFLYLGAPELSLENLGAGDWVEWDGVRYDVTAAHPVELGSKRMYWWAVLTVREAEETAGD